MGIVVVVTERVLSWSSDFYVPSVYLELATPLALGSSIPWDQLESIAATDPWPCFAIRRRGAGATVVSPVGRDHEAFAAVVEQLLATAANRGASVELGWLALPDRDWERVESMPNAGDASGPFRGASEPVEALREESSWLARNAARVARMRDRPVSPRTVMITPRYVYTQDWNGIARRVELDALRARREIRWGGAIYSFHRRTELVLPRRRNCPVRLALDQRLNAITSL